MFKLNAFQLRKELSKGAIVFAVFGLAKPTYYIYKIVMVSLCLNVVLIIR